MNSNSPKLLPLRVLEAVTADGDRFKVQLDGLRAVLAERGCMEKEVVPVVIAGVFRKGKSFLLNFLHRFLRSGTGGGDWLRDGGAAVQDGFPWRGGPQRDTTGIVCWPEPFLVDDGGGGKKVVLLLDTQGLCDLRTGKRGNGTVFVLSALLASTLIFNLDERFREDEWQMLQQFIALAQAAANATGGNNGEDHDDDHDDDEGHLKLFQEVLFLVRNWYDPELEFGFRGGAQYLAEEMGQLPSRGALPTACQQPPRCFLMPHPGDVVASDRFDGNIDDISPLFIQQLRDLVTNILSPNRLQAKQHLGRPLTVAAWLDMFETYGQAFASGELPAPCSFLAASADVSHKMALQEAVNLYRQEVDKWFTSGESLTDGQLANAHSRSMADALAAFDGSKKLSSQQSQSAEYRLKLTGTIQKIYTKTVAAKNATLRGTKASAEQAEFARQKEGIAHEKRLLDEERKNRDENRRDDVQKERANIEKLRDEERTNASHQQQLVKVAIEKQGEQTEAIQKGMDALRKDNEARANASNERMDHMQKTLDATQEAIDNIPEQQEGFFGAVGRVVAGVATLGMSEVFRKK